jgi:hypothetical protein
MLGRRLPKGLWGLKPEARLGRFSKVMVPISIPSSALGVPHPAIARRYGEVIRAQRPNVLIYLVPRPFLVSDFVLRDLER